MTALTFASGLHLIYKPKSLRLDAAFQDLLAWTAERGAPLRFRRLRSLCRPGYGWTELADAVPCRNAEELQRFDLRMGMLLCLVYALAGTDAHCENIIAAGEHPLLIDAETLFHPPPVTAMAAEADLEIRALPPAERWRSVLGAGILPTWELGREGQIYDASSLRDVTGQETAALLPRFRHVNTDVMELCHEPGIVETSAHLPHPAGAPARLPARCADVLDGFRQMYRLLLDHREELRAADGPLAAFAGEPCRFLRRTSRLYIHRLFEALRAEHLRDGADFGIQLDVLSREMLDSETPPPFWPLLTAEIESLEEMDIPLVLARIHDGEISVPGRPLRGRCATVPGGARAAATLERLGEADLDLQSGLIRASLQLQGGALLPVSTGAFSAAEALRWAAAIAEDLRRRAVPLPGGGAVWLAVEARLGGERHQLLPVGYDLYDGTTGVAVFLAALARITGEAWCRSLAQEALLPLRHRLAAPGGAHDLARRTGLGGAFGCGSLLYGLTLCGELLDAPELWQDAAAAAAALTLERIAADTGFDVVSGTAGALLGLLALHEVRPGAELMERAAACGRHLLAGRIAGGEGAGVWAAPGLPPQTGFAHGAAGIALALARLSQVTGDPAFRDAAEAAVAWESLLWDPAAGNWQDLRPRQPEGAGPMVAWCNGAPGIALSRLGILAVLDTGTVRLDLERALATTQRFGGGKLDHLCCGSFGRTGILALAGERLGRPDLALKARQLAAATLARAGQDGSFRLSTTLPPGFHVPGLFQGEAGIGYELLRLAFPGTLPAVLLWETAAAAGGTG